MLSVKNELFNHACCYAWFRGAALPGTIRSSLFGLVVGDREKKASKVTPVANVIKLFTAVSFEFS